MKTQHFWVMLLPLVHENNFHNTNHYVRLFHNNLNILSKWCHLCYFLLYLHYGSCVATKRQHYWVMLLHFVGKQILPSIPIIMLLFPNVKLSLESKSVKKMEPLIFFHYSPLNPPPIPILEAGRPWKRNIFRYCCFS